jgi:DNA-binding PadR family transcriptional regulator
MRRTNKTEFAILGLLSLYPMSGYHMKAFIAQSIGFFWQESYGQIYPALRKLLSRGLIDRKVRRQKSRPDRHVYSLTARGRERLSEWLHAETDPEPVRQELLLKLFFGPTVDAKVHVQHVQTLLEQQTERLKTFERIEKTGLKPYENDPAYPFYRSTVRYGQYITRARMRWCRETLAWLRNQADDKQ